MVGIVLNFAFVMTEVLTGFWTNSLALLTDAGHNLSDVASLALSLLAFRLAKIKPSNTYTYGFRKATVLVALLNAVILLAAMGSIAYQALLRFQQQQAVQGNTVAIVAAIGICINAFTAYLFMHNKDQDLNLKSAYLHLAADALVSLGVVVGGLLIAYTHWLWLDSVISLLIAVVVVVGTWRLLTDSLRLSLDGVPHNVDVEKIKHQVNALPHVAQFTHIHVWAISTTKNALTAELFVKDLSHINDIEQLKNTVKHELAHHNIQHSTIEVSLDHSSSSINDC